MKRVDRGRTRTTVRRLDEPARVEEVARMLGGEAISDGLRASAREMLVGRKVGAKAKGESESPVRAASGAKTAKGPKGKH